MQRDLAFSRIVGYKRVIFDLCHDARRRLLAYLRGLGVRHTACFDSILDHQCQICSVKSLVFNGQLLKSGGSSRSIYVSRVSH